MGEIFLGIIAIIIGCLIVIKTHFFIYNFGKILWAEKYLDILGGTVAFYKLLGILIVFIGILLTLHLEKQFLGFILKPIFKPFSY